MDCSRIPSVEDIENLEARGPWKTKSKGDLTVLLAIPLTTVLNRFLVYDPEELAKIPQDICGLRLYPVRNLPKGESGGGEFHRVRKEFFFGLDGKILMTCDDLYGGTRSFMITPDFGIYIPNFIRHSYVVMEERSGFLVIANTLFIPDNPRTHDTYKTEEFELLKMKTEERRHEK